MKKVRNKYHIIRPLFLGLMVLTIAVMITRNVYQHEEEKKDAFRRIRERGYLIALTDKNTLNYFIYRGEPMGYQLTLLESFAQSLGLPLKIIASNDIAKLEYYIRNNAADILALNLPVTSTGRKEVRFSIPFGETRLVLVQKKRLGNEPDVRDQVISLKSFPADTVYVRQNPFHASLNHLFFRATGRRAILNEIRDITQEELIRRVSEGKIRYALCEENVVMVYKRYYRNIDASVIAHPLYSYSWGVGLSSDSLLMKINSWLQEYKSSRQLRRTYLAYFDNQRIVSFLKSDYFSENGNRLSPFDDVIRNQARLIFWDWRLLASVIYEESNFRQGQVSSQNASGLMQLMPDIAARYGVDSGSGIAHQIAAGVRYFKYLDSQLPSEIEDPRERIYFLLASYNVGLGRVLSAREKADQYGVNINKWNGHVDYYLLRRSKRDTIAVRDTIDSYPVDYKLEGYVDNIITRFYHYRNLIE